LIDPKQPDVTIGKVVAPFGIKGEVKVTIETDFPERFEDLDEVWLEPETGCGWVATVDSVRFHQTGALIKFQGCDDRNRAEELRGAELRIPESELMELEEDQFYVHDLLGLDVFTVSGEHVGHITYVLQGAANDVYVTERGMIPAVKQFVKKVDLAERKIIVDPIEGMLE
jgi:16S rRNA processing protein RimM